MGEYIQARPWASSVSRNGKPSEPFLRQPERVLRCSCVAAEMITASQDDRPRARQPSIENQTCTPATLLKKRFKVYVIDVETTRAAWTVRLRYSELYAFHSQLVQRWAEAPEFPSKWSLDMHKRFELLDEYIKIVSTDPAHAVELNAILQNHAERPETSPNPRYRPPSGERHGPIRPSVSAPATLQPHYPPIRPAQRPAPAASRAETPSSEGAAESAEAVDNDLTAPLLGGSTQPETALPDLPEEVSAPVVDAQVGSGPSDAEAAPAADEAQPPPAAAVAATDPADPAAAPASAT